MAIAGGKYPKLVSVALLLLTLAVGFLGGLAWGNGSPKDGSGEQAESRRGNEGSSSRGGRAGDGRRSAVIDRVEMDEETRSQVNALIEHYRTEMRALDEEFQETYRPRQRTLVREAREAIMAVLSPEQQAVYDSLLTARYRSRDRDGDSIQGRDSIRGRGR